MSSSGAEGDAIPAGTDRRLGALLRAALELTAEHDVDRILDRTVRCAAEVAGARYAALGVYDAMGRLERFVHHGIDAATAARIGDPPQGRGLLGAVLEADAPIRVADVGSDRRATGVPAGHPPMRRFLGVPVHPGDRRFGNLYLSGKDGGGEFDEEDERLVATLAAFAAAAIEAALLVTTERELAATRERTLAQRELLGRVIGAQEAERARVARDLHDQVGQSLTSVLLGLRLVDRSLAGDAPELDDVRAHSDEVRDLVAEALDQVRRLAFELRPTVLDDVGLVAALRRLAGDLGERHGVTVDLTLGGFDDEVRLPSELETVVYRVVQEALTNVVRHAQASRASVVLAVDAGGIRAEIVDDGVGFEVDEGPPSSLGLAGMVERAALVDGRMAIHSTRGRGTRVVLEVPR
jgi:signal transduction histidine kinase